MAKLTMSKSALKHQRDELARFRRFLPTLDLKRQQLLTERKKALHQLAQIESDLDVAWRKLGEVLELLGASNTDLSGLVQVEALTMEEENIVGAGLPVLGEIKFREVSYSTLAKPFWVDFLVEDLQHMVLLQISLQVCRERLARLNYQVRRITQRTNLFEKILIPRAEQNIKRIQIALGEHQRSAVVRSKLAKKKQIAH